MAKGKKTGGRQKGRPNKATAEVKAFCSSIVDSPGYQARFRQRALSGDLHPSLEAMMWYYAKGKPTEAHDQQVRGALVHLLGGGPLPSDEELGL